MAAFPVHAGCRHGTRLLGGQRHAARVAQRIWTIGYEDRELDELVGALREASIGRVVDVRERAQSRKPGLSKTPLSEALAQAGIDYENPRELGVPKAVRDPYKAGGPFEDLERWYEGHLDGLGVTLLDGLAGQAREDRVCLLCYEAEAGACHRGLLAKRLTRHGFEATHL